MEITSQRSSTETIKRNYNISELAGKQSVLVSFLYYLIFFTKHKYYFDKRRIKIKNKRKALNLYCLRQQVAMEILKHIVPRRVYFKFFYVLWPLSVAEGCLTHVQFFPCCTLLLCSLSFNLSISLSFSLSLSHIHNMPEWINWQVS